MALECDRLQKAKTDKKATKIAISARFVTAAANVYENSYCGAYVLVRQSVTESKISIFEKSENIKQIFISLFGVNKVRAHIRQTEGRKKNEISFN